MMRALCGLLLLALVGCAAPVQQGPTVASSLPAGQLGVMQSRIVAADPRLVQRAVVAMLHDQGYRFTSIDIHGAVSAIKANRLLVSIVVVPTGGGQVVVRANALMGGSFAPGFTQVDLPEFYQRNIFDPLGGMLGQALQPVGAGQALPNAVTPYERPPSLLPG